VVLLNLESNNIEEAGMLALAEMLVTSHIREVRLMHQRTVVPTTALEALVAAVQARFPVNSMCALLFCLPSMAGWARAPATGVASLVSTCLSRASSELSFF
jgi:hypothetical protein